MRNIKDVEYRTEEKQNQRQKNVVLIKNLLVFFHLKL